MSANKQIRRLAAQLPRIIDALEGEWNTVNQRMKALQAQGLIYAAEHWRESKYLYLIYPMHEGKRRREYIGAHADRIAAARAGIERAKKFDELSARLKHLDACMTNGVAALQEAGRRLESW